MKAKGYAAFLRFCRLQHQYHDHYPHVVVWRGVADDLRLPPARRYWMALLYMAFYQDGCMWWNFSRPAVASRREPPVWEGLPISYQRRNLFGGRIARHLEALAAIPDLGKWLEGADWPELLRRLEGVYGNGRWAAYTTAEMLVGMGHPARPDTYEIAGSSGPKQGLEGLGLEPTEDVARRLHERVVGEGVDAPPEEFESYLCNWSRVLKSDFYVGYNLDRQQGRLRRIEKEKGVVFSRPWRVRARVFPADGLGEVGGWAGVDKARCKAYTATGRILAPNEER